MELDLLMKAESERLRREMEIGLQWWKERVIDNPEQAFKYGRLVLVPFEGYGYRLGRTLEGKYQFLNPSGYNILTILGMRWLNLLSAFRMPNAAAFSVRSLYLIEGEAVEDIPYRAGACFDITLNEYYLNGKRISKEDSKFDPRYVDLLIDILSGIRQAGLCSIIMRNKFDLVEGQIKASSSQIQVCAAPSIL